MAAQEDDLEEARAAQEAAEELLNQGAHFWETPNKRLKVRFGKPEGLISITLARILGPGQAANVVLDRIYRAFAGIREVWIYQLGFDGKPDLKGAPQHQELDRPVTIDDFMYLETLFDGDDDLMNAYVGHFFEVLYPDMVEMYRKVIASGGGPEAIEAASREGHQLSVKK